MKYPIKAVIGWQNGYHLCTVIVDGIKQVVHVPVKLCAKAGMMIEVGIEGVEPCIK